jgi:hypothetical protein
MKKILPNSILNPSLEVTMKKRDRAGYAKSGRLRNLTREQGNDLRARFCIARATRVTPNGPSVDERWDSVVVIILCLYVVTLWLAFLEVQASSLGMVVRNNLGIYWLLHSGDVPRAF